jgi:hypothetical protein
MKCGCVQNTKRIFWYKLQDVPNRETAHTVVNKLRNTGSL